MAKKLPYLPLAAKTVIVTSSPGIRSCGYIIYPSLVIKDEGKGFSVDEVKYKQESYGILGMKERVELFGGEISIITYPGQGTQVIIKVPVKEEAK